LASPGSSARSNHWLRAIGYGLLAEVSTVVTIIAVATLYRYVFARGLMSGEYDVQGVAFLGDVFNERIGAVVGVVGGTLYTFLFAQRLMRHVSARFVAHGIVAALAAVALSIGGSIAGHHGVPTGYMLASALKIIAGALAGFLATRKGAPRAA
jgi:hypothetical protein